MKALEVSLKLDIKDYRFDVLELDEGDEMTPEQMKEAAAPAIIDCLKALGEELASEGTYEDSGSSASVTLEIV